MAVEEAEHPGSNPGAGVAGSLALPAAEVSTRCFTSLARFFGIAAAGPFQYAARPF